MFILIKSRSLFEIGQSLCHGAPLVPKPPDRVPTFAALVPSSFLQWYAHMVKKLKPAVEIQGKVSPIPRNRFFPEQDLGEDDLSR
jgi:hypothetical protein